ncbi:hypothetical protein VKT23_003208 [Stygiomarasmius scandens]|uniref:Uncharacterized protein n=1 Tax=Marasmiellus scandens TaxID=2682957 RepID=A0ABR1JX92_9AGAR
MLTKRPKSKSNSWAPSSKARDPTASASSPQPFSVSSTQLDTAKRDAATRRSMSSGKTSFFANLFTSSSAKSTPAHLQDTDEPSSSQPSFPGNLAMMRNVSPEIYDDPAFSPDPRSNPLFVTNPDPPSSSPVPGHPGFNPCPNHIPFSSESSTLSEEEASTQLHSSPNDSYEDDPVDFLSATPSTSQSSSLDTPPSSYESMPLFKSKSSSIASVKPVQDVADSGRPFPPRHISAPEVPRGKPQIDVPVRSNTAPIKAGLDPIDEMDETNPAGIAFHHGSPYEVAKKISAPLDEMAGQLSRSLSLDHRNPRPIPIVPFVSFGTSLNLRPGQVIPHDFHPYIDPPIQAVTPPRPPRNPQQNQQGSRQQQQSQPMLSSHPQQPIIISPSSPPPPYSSRANTPQPRRLQNLHHPRPHHLGSPPRSRQNTPSPKPAPLSPLPNPWNDAGHRRQVSDIQEVDEDDDARDNRPEDGIYGGISEGEEEDAAYQGDGTLEGALGSWFEPEQIQQNHSVNNDVSVGGPQGERDAVDMVGRALYGDHPRPVRVEPVSQNNGLGSNVQGYAYGEPFVQPPSTNVNGVPALPAHMSREPSYASDRTSQSSQPPFTNAIGVPAFPAHMSREPSYASDRTSQSNQPPFTNVTGVPAFPSHMSREPSYASDRTSQSNHYPVPRPNLPYNPSFAPGPPQKHTSLPPSARYDVPVDGMGPPRASNTQRHYSMDSNSNAYTADNASTVPSAEYAPRRQQASSIHPSLGTTTSTATNGGLRPRHLPKQLVMPAPLQGQPRSPNNKAAHRSPGHGSSQPHHSRSISAQQFGSGMAPLTGPPPKSGSVLRKRESMSVAPSNVKDLPPPVKRPVPTSSLSWENIEAQAMDRSRSLSAKPSKRVLSKRR